MTYDEKGITPACAGIRPKSSLPAPCSWDHPRVRGDKSPPVTFSPWPMGSPPRARG